MKTTIVVTLIVICLAACSPATEITGSWKRADAGEQKINSVMVTAMTSHTHARQTVENDLARALQQNGVRTLKSLDVLPPTFTNGDEPDREELMEKINGTDVDAILTVALLDKETENRYVPGSYGYEPVPRFGYYGRFWGYYTTWYPMLYSPGYYEEDKVYFIETNLYDADTEELLWSAQSETYNPRGLEEFSREFANAVLQELEDDGLIDGREGRPLATDR